MAKPIRPFLFRNVRRHLSVLVDFEVNNAQERFAIPEEVRKEGFLCRQLNTDEFFILEGGILNQHWIPFDLKWLFNQGPGTGPVEGDFSKNFQTSPPNVHSVNVGDSWTDPLRLKEYRLIDQDGERWWVETTSPRIMLGKLFDHTFDKSFN